MKQFRSFRLDTVNHCLWQGEDRISLTPKAFDMLRYLVEHADRLVTQDEILEALWPETYVNPEVIKKYILVIRKVLGDRRDKPEFIKTFPRRGYRFVAPVSELGAGTPSDLGLDQLGGYLGQALNAQRQVIFMAGEAGAGMTNLVDEFHQTATPLTAIFILSLSVLGVDKALSPPRAGATDNAQRFVDVPVTRNRRRFQPPRTRVPKCERNAQAAQI
jgi:DNA-binding winged helix-turn-helix (wHTH) protein